MEDDLADVGLSALEAMEAEDEKATNEPEESSEQEDTKEETGGQETDTPEETGAEENDSDEDSEDAGENEGEGDKETEEETSEPKKEEKSDDKELSDEEFEEMARKRGYSKSPNEDEKAKETEEAATREKLLKRPKEIDEELWDELPEDNKVIYNALPYIQAEGENGVVRVKTPEQLPEGFKFKDDRAAMRFQNDLQAQENRATEMANALAARAERAERANAERAEAQKVVSEIEGLQKSGDLPTPKAKAGTKEFDDDPAVVLINKVLGYRAERANAGANLSVRDAMLIYRAEHPEEFSKKEAKGDVERKNIAKKVAGASKASGTAVNKDDNKPQYYKTGMSTEDVLDRVLDDME